uniref:Uncharacterized protein n=1 Tax=Oryza punctata TaxID=4537 RepID=A0A0E0K193_ORYPU
MRRRSSGSPPSSPPAAQLSGGVCRGGSSQPPAIRSAGSGSRSGARPSRLSGYGAAEREVAVLSSPRPRRSRPTAGRVDKKMRRFVGTKVNQFEALIDAADSHDDDDDDVAPGAGSLGADDITAARSTPSPRPAHASSRAPVARSKDDTHAMSPNLSPAAEPYTPVSSRAAPVSRSPRTVRGPAITPAGVRHQGFPTQWPTPAESSPPLHGSGGGRGVPRAHGGSASPQGGGAGAGAGGGRSVPDPHGGSARSQHGGGSGPGAGGGARRVVYPWNVPVPQAFPLARCSICGAVALRYSFCCSRILCGTCGCQCEPPAVVVLPPPALIGSVYQLVIHQPTVLQGALDALVAGDVVADAAFGAAGDEHHRLLRLVVLAISGVQSSINRTCATSTTCMLISTSRGRQSPPPHGSLHRARTRVDTRVAGVAENARDI